MSFLSILSSFAEKPRFHPRVHIHSNIAILIWNMTPRGFGGRGRQGGKGVSEHETVQFPEMFKEVLPA